MVAGRRGTGGGWRGGPSIRLGRLLSSSIEDLHPIYQQSSKDWLIRRLGREWNARDVPRSLTKISFPEIMDSCCEINALRSFNSFFFSGSYSPNRFGSHPPALFARFSFTSCTVVLSVTSILVGSFLIGFLGTIIDVSTFWSIEDGRHTATRNFQGDGRCHGNFPALQEDLEGCEVWFATCWACVDRASKIVDLATCCVARDGEVPRFASALSLPLFFFSRHLFASKFSTDHFPLPYYSHYQLVYNFRV